MCGRLRQEFYFDIFCKDNAFWVMGLDSEGALRQLASALGAWLFLVNYH